MKMQKIKMGVLSMIIFSGMIISCQPYQTSETGKTKESTPITKAVCVLHPTEDNTASGVVNFTKTDSGILITAKVTGLSEGKHGFHVHEYGDCTAADGTSTGGHFNPDNKDHGAPTDLDRHVGDLGNIIVNADSVGFYDRVDTVISFEGKHSIIGRGMIIHAGEDDLVSQPTGNAGARIACGVIGIAK